MKKVLMVAGATALFSTSAFAAPGDQVSVDVNASVQEECSIETPTTFQLGDLPINEDPGPDALLQTETIRAAQNVWMSCNYSTTIGVASANNTLLNSGTVTDTDNFTNRRNYNVGFVRADGSNFAFGSWATFLGSQKSVLEPAEFHENAELFVRVPHFEYQNNTKRPISGAYTDTLTITLGTI
jgi:hypothetical protein